MPSKIFVDQRRRTGDFNRRTTIYRKLSYLLLATALLLPVLSFLTNTLDEENVVQWLHPFKWKTAKPDCAFDNSPSVLLIWTTSAKLFLERNYASIDSIFDSSPCAEVVIMSNMLPFSYFERYLYSHMNLRLISIDDFVRISCSISMFNSRGHSDGFVVHNDFPGCRWIQSKTARHGPYYDVHLTDVLRMMYIYRYGGSYMDFDHLILRPIFEPWYFGVNVFGTELCRDDNPDCLTVEDMLARNIIDAHHVNNAKTASRALFGSNKHREEVLRYTPCNGVIINWEPHHRIFLAALQHADEEYDAGCWGCLGPRLLGSLLLDINSFGSLKLLPPGLIYASDYSLAKLAIKEQLVPSADFFENSTGIHIYGKTVGSEHITRSSTVGQIFYHQEHLLFLHSHGQGSKTYLLGRGVHTFPTETGLFRTLVHRSGTVLICHSDWLGIKEATMRIAIEIGLPIIFLRSLYLDKKFIQFLHSLHIKTLLVQGIVPGIIEFARTNNKVNFGFHIKVIYHSGVGVHNMAPDEAQLLKATFELCQEKAIGLVFIEEDQNYYARALGVPNTFVASHAFSRVVHNSLKPEKHIRKLGLLGTSTRFAVKNFWPQISSACMFNDTEIHVSIDQETLSRLVRETHLSFCNSRIVNHGIVNPTVFDFILREMDLNLYISATDALPNVVLDSLSRGIPILTSDTSEIFFGSPLKSYCVVHRIEDPHAIFDAINALWEFSRLQPVKFREDVSSLLQSLRERSEISWKQLLSLH